MTMTVGDDRTYLREVLATPLPTLPAKLTRLGPVEADWFELVDTPGVVVINTTGGTSPQRCVAEIYLREQLREHGYHQATIDMELIPFQKTAAWSDIMAKAKRLIQSGQVTVASNSWQNVIGHIVGDHGEYNTEFSREDPNSGVITQWKCECPWAQYAWGRTRQWKKYEGRVCAHTLALYWKSRSTPIEGQGPNQPQRGQMGTPSPMGPPAPGDAPGMPPGAPPAAPPGAPPETAPTDAGPAQGQLFDPSQAPASSGVIPPFPGEQMSLFDQWAGPGTTPGGGKSPPWAVSVPGARQPDFNNPIQNPSTYSKVAGRDLTPGERVTLLEDEYGTKTGKDDDGEWKLVPAGTPGQVFDFDASTGLMSVLFELHGGNLSSYHVRCYVDRNAVKPVAGRSPLDPGLKPKRKLI